MIIFCEKKYAEERLKNGFSKKMSRIDLGILAKYFKYLGKSYPQIRESLIQFCKNFDDAYNENYYYKRIEDAIKISKKEALRIYSPIGITKKEIDTIRSVPEFRYQKILFLLLFIGKVFYKPEHKGYYVNHKVSQIFTLAKMNPTKKQREEIEGKIEDLNLLTTSMNGTWKINFVDENQNDFVIVINDPEDPLSQLNFVCFDCKKEMPQKSNRQIYCNECLNNRRKEEWHKRWNFV